ncbi:hypothetical protein [Schleiferilactobacillus perolens]|uniref:Extracellular protein n=1 Tax=Schleiferilactobacillus perolens DSM 12744 TaxID=1423792 RepID=A0A0R1N3W5_9LACO|nr:hypothetical protein [Schleiferilactobacillus perolens]KRL12453.1 hypothetical protein FD09_GL003039 [Schleiferilactobacillus perolens DSM 12744]
MKSIKVSGLVGLTVLALATATPISVAAADNQAVPINVGTASNSQDQGSDFVDAIDQYVHVINNQFVLDVPTNSGIPENRITDTREILSRENDTIRKLNLTIDPTTKSIQQPGIEAPSNSGFNAPSIQWYGVRYSFTSNAQVASFHATTNRIRSETTGAAAFIGLMSVPAYAVTPIGGTVVTFIAGQLGAFRQLVGDAGDGIASFNESHTHDYIHLELHLWSKYYVPGVGA